MEPYAGAHVQIKVQVDPEGTWRELPGNWIIPVSTYANIYANRVKDKDGKPVTPDIDEDEGDEYHETWHGLRHTVTAIQWYAEQQTRTIKCLGRCG